MRGKISLPHFGFIFFFAAVFIVIMSDIFFPRPAKQPIIIAFADRSMPVSFPDCAPPDTIMNVVSELIGNSGPPANGAVIITAVNDIMCEDQENMFNAMLVAVPLNNPPHVARVHIHFRPNGTLASPDALRPRDWSPLAKLEDWKIPWCDFMRSTYPKEYTLWGCPENTNQ